MECKICGKQIEDNSKFCTFCGNEVIRKAENNYFGRERECPYETVEELEKWFDCWKTQNNIEIVCLFNTQYYGNDSVFCVGKVGDVYLVTYTNDSRYHKIKIYHGTSEETAVQKLYNALLDYANQISPNIKTDIVHTYDVLEKSDDQKFFERVEEAIDNETKEYYKQEYEKTKRINERGHILSSLQIVAYVVGILLFLLLTVDFTPKETKSFKDRSNDSHVVMDVNVPIDATRDFNDCNEIRKKIFGKADLMHDKYYTASATDYTGVYFFYYEYNELSGTHSWYLLCDTINGTEFQLVANSKNDKYIAIGVRNSYDSIDALREMYSDAKFTIPNVEISRDYIKMHEFGG